MKKFKWVIEIEVDETWVADGFDPDDEQAKEMLASFLRSAYNNEIDAKVIKRPTDKSIANAQGYGKVSDYKKSNWKDGRRV
jgi:hypothetical protein